MVGLEFQKAPERNGWLSADGMMNTLQPRRRVHGLERLQPTVPEHDDMMENDMLAPQG
jgi:hypothetical protein